MTTTDRNNKLASICFKKKLKRSYHLHRAYQVQGKTKWDTHQISTEDMKIEEKERGKEENNETLYSVQRQA